VRSDEFCLSVSMTDSTKAAAATRPGSRDGRSIRFRRDTLPLPMWIYNVQSLKFLVVNQPAVERYGLARAEFLDVEVTSGDLVEGIDRARLGTGKAGLA
jgi:hypothetical protein